MTATPASYLPRDAARNANGNGAYPKHAKPTVRLCAHPCAPNGQVLPDLTEGRQADHAELGRDTKDEGWGRPVRKDVSVRDNIS